MSQPLANPANLSSYKTLLTKGVQSNSNKATKKEEFRDSKYRPHEVKRNRKRSKSRSPSPRPEKTGYKKSRSDNKKEKIDYDIPDRHFGDYFCKACECHMNSEDMWHHHIVGKRHAKNTGGSQRTVIGKKYDDINGEPPEALKLIEDEEKPLVGLSDIRESQKPDRTTYYCFLCSASIETGPLMIEHVVSTKHRMNYLKEYDKDRFIILNESNLNKEQMEAIVLECVTKIEQEKGRGKMKIQRKIPSAYDDEDYRKSERGKQGWKQPPSPGGIPLSGANLTPRAPFRNEDSRSQDPYPPYDDDRYYRRSPERMLPRERDLPPPRDSMYEARRDYYDDNYSMSSRGSSKPPMGIASNEGDLREVLQQKRSNENNITDEALSIISALPAVSFFQLVLFKLDSIDIENEMELKYLDRVVNKATAMSMKINSQKFAPTLVEKFKESVQKNSVEVSSVPTSSTSMQDLLRLVEDYKDLRKLEKPVEPRIQSVLPQERSAAQTLYSSLYSVSEAPRAPQPMYTQQPVSTIDSSALLFGSDQRSYDSSYSSSNTVSIPGLTLTQSQDHSDTNSPFRDLEAKTKSIFGLDQWSASNAQMPPYAYRNEQPY